MTNSYWIFKSEPETFSIDDLMQAKNQTTSWEGVRNYQARNYLRDHIKKGDQGFFYHSSCAIPAIVGLIQVVRQAYPDPTAWILESPYFDPKSTPTQPRWFMVDVQLKEKLPAPLPLSLLKEIRVLEDCPLVRKGNRLSIIPLTLQQWQGILKLIHKSNQ